ncbi:MAG: N-acetylglucosamine kinase [Synechococcus sp. NP17]|nr:N-acetylglucosamine kinase [Synechococcus sp. NP17]|tara:strand:- start:5960 stop:6904 length:945 start_codon:yes stop_codon:yes gene_type:complete
MNDMPILAGFDAGQTHCRCKLSQWSRGEWHLLGEGQGSGVSHLQATGGESRFIKAIHSSLRAANVNNLEIDAAAVGASGVEQGTPHQTLARDLLATSLNLPKQRCIATGDERTALRAAFPNDAGVVLISGTGMIVVGRNDKGLEQRCGGWGWQLDGAGAAFDIGHQGLQLSLRMADGRLPDGPLRKQLWHVLGCSTAAEIKAVVVQPDFQPAKLAQLAPLVSAAADAGDLLASAIIDRSGDALAEAAQAVASSLGLLKPVFCARGGALLNLAPLQKAVHTALSRRRVEARWDNRNGDACDGALLLALELLIKTR